jgi:hypothetical protein
MKGPMYFRIRGLDGVTATDVMMGLTAFADVGQLRTPQHFGSNGKFNGSEPMPTARHSPHEALNYEFRC